MKKGFQLALEPHGFEHTLFAISAGAHVRCLRAFRAAPGLKFHFLTFLEGPKTIRLNVSVMHEEIFAAIVGLDKSKALFLVKPLHGTLCHLYNLL